MSFRTTGSGHTGTKLAINCLLNFDVFGSANKGNQTPCRRVNYFAWCFRGFVTNEFDSGRYSDTVTLPSGENLTQGEAILIQFGFVDSDGDPYTSQWAGWGVLFAIATGIIAVFGTVQFLSHIRFATGKSLVTDKGEDEVYEEEITTEEQVSIPFTRVDLTFKDIHYTVTSSITDEKLELLKGIDGVVEAGRMTGTNLLRTYVLHF